MIHDFIADLYQAGRDTEARRALAREIAREQLPEDADGPPTYEPTEAEIASAEAEYYAARRRHLYGPPERQMEYITEHGLAAWQDEVASIKAEVPKPEGG